MVSKSLALLALLSAPTQAVFIKSELDVIDPEPLYDSEYFLDLLAFSYPLDWQWEWDSNLSSGGYRINGASFDATDLFVEQEALIRRRFWTWDGPQAPGLDAAYRLEHRGDKDLEDLHQWISLEAGPWKGFSGGLFGEPTPAKEDADIGILARYRPFPGLSLWGRRYAVDWNFNQRNRANRRYDTKPLTYHLGTDWTRERSRLRVLLEIDTPLKRVDPALNQTYNYQRNTFLARWDLPSIKSDPGFAAGYRYELKREGAFFEPDPNRQNLDFRRHVHNLFGAALIPLTDKDRLEAGAHALAHWGQATFLSSRASDTRHTRWEVQPYARWRRSVRPWSEAELAAFISYGELRREMAVSEFHKPVEAKLGFGWDFRDPEQPRAWRLGFYGNADLDDLDRHIWDGGNIRGQWMF